MRILTSAALIPFVLLVANSCTDSSEPDPVMLEVLTQPPPQSIVGARVSASVRARRGGRNAAGINVAWRIESGAGSVSATNSVTDAEGRAEVEWTLGNAPTSNVLAAEGEGQTLRFTVATEADAAADLVLVSGDNQSGVVAQALSDSLAVRVVDRLNNPRPAASVTFQTTGGSLSATTVLTSTDGMAKVRWTLGNTAGEQHAIARLGATDSVQFRATGRAGAAVSGSIRPPATPIAAGDSVHLEFVGRDQFGNEITGRPATYTSADTSIAVITANGALRGITAGTVRINGQMEGASASQDITLAAFRYTRLTTGSDHTCAVAADNRLYCFGGGAQGALGTGDGNDRLIPTEVNGARTYSRVAAYSQFTCGLASADQRIYCWGRNNEAQLGNGTATLTPVLLPGPTLATAQFSNVSARFGTACGLTTDVRVLCWGGGSLTIDERASGIAFVEISGSPVNGHACGLTASGQAYCWGKNNAGQLGVNQVLDSPVPLAVLGPAFASITVGEEHTCAIALNGELYCWGRADLGQLGYIQGPDALENCGPILCRKLPTIVPGGFEMGSVFAYGSSTCGTTLDFTAYCWGKDDGQLGNTVANSGQCNSECDPEPTPVETGLRLRSIVIGEKHGCALRNDTNDLYCWGANNVGQLGRNVRDAATITATPTPVFAPRK